MKTRFAATFVAVLVLAAAVYADDKKAVPPAQANQPGMRTNLGVALMPVPPMLASQMPDLKGRGVLIANVIKDSPADKAGIKPNDVLVSFDKHDVSSPEQLINLIQADKPGHEAALDVVRAAKHENIKVTLGSAPIVQFPQPGPFPPVSQGQKTIWDTFDSLSLTRMDDTHFKAEIAYKNDKGTVERKKFEGTRDEIRQKIETEKDLPTIEREQLLNAFSLRPRAFEPPFR